MKIKSVKLNNRKKAIEIETAKSFLSLPFSKLRVKPTAENKIVKIFLDKELANKAVTYTLESGISDSVHIDAFFDYNKDPDYLRKLALHRLTIEANELYKDSELSKQELMRRLQTSPSQLYRLFDPANQTKSVDEMLRLLAALGYRVEWKVIKDVA